MDRTLRRRAGFSLVELMIAVGILVIVVAAVMQSFVVQNKAYTVTDQVVEAQQSLRAVAWLLERDARMTGFLVPEAAAVCAVDNVALPDKVWFTDADALDPDGQTRPALGAEVTGYGENPGPDGLTVDNIILDDTGIGSSGFYDRDGDGTGDSDFVEKHGVILVDVDDPARGVACGVVSSIAGNVVNVDFENAIDAGDGDRLILVPAHVYEVVTFGVDEPQLLRNGELIATGVEDLQVAFFFDMNRDGVIDGVASANGEMPGEAGGDVYAANGYDNRDLREIRLNLVTRTRMDDVANDEGRHQTRENRVASGPGDGYRRRVHSSTVKLRNVGYRGTST